MDIFSNPNLLLSTPCEVLSCQFRFFNRIVLIIYSILLKYRCFKRKTQKKISSTLSEVTSEFSDKNIHLLRDKIQEAISCVRESSRIEEQIIDDMVTRLNWSKEQLNSEVLKHTSIIGNVSQMQINILIGQYFLDQG